jgi:hypothetical protein
VSRETLDVAYEQWLLPGREQIPGDPSDEDQVGRAGPYELIGDRDLAAAGIAHLGRLHGGSFAYRSSRRSAARPFPPSR